MTIEHSNPELVRAKELLEKTRHALQWAPDGEKLAILEHTALGLAEFVRSGAVEEGKATLVLTDIARLYELHTVYGDDRVRSLIAHRLAGHATAGRSLIVSRASDIMPEQIEWLWPGRFAVGKLSLLVGHPGLGKSQAALLMAATVSAGRDWPCGEGTAARGRVIVLSTEDGRADTIRPRLDAARADASRIYVASAVIQEAQGRRMFSLKADLDLLDMEIERIGDVRLVIIDPVSSYMASVATHDNAMTRAVLAPIAEMAERRRVAVLAISHFSKTGSARVLDRVIGSIAFAAAVRSAYTVVRDAGDPRRRLFLELKNNLASGNQGLAFRFEQMRLPNAVVGASVAFEGAPISLSADETLAAVNDRGNAMSKRCSAAEFLRELLTPGPLPVQEVGRHLRSAGFLAAGRSLADSITVRRAREALGIKPIRTGGIAGEGQWVWGLPAEAKQA